VPCFARINSHSIIAFFSILLSTNQHYYFVGWWNSHIGECHHCRPRYANDLEHQGQDSHTHRLRYELSLHVMDPIPLGHCASIACVACTGSSDSGSLQTHNSGFPNDVAHNDVRWRDHLLLNPDKGHLALGFRLPPHSRDSAGIGSGFTQRVLALKALAGMLGWECKVNSYPNWVFVDLCGLSPCVEHRYVYVYFRLLKLTP
jgi:hypothetical protein